jgi:hypothetical protein
MELIPNLEGSSKISQGQVIKCRFWKMVAQGNLLVLGALPKKNLIEQLKFCCVFIHGLSSSCNNKLVVRKLLSMQSTGNIPYLQPPYLFLYSLLILYLVFSLLLLTFNISHYFPTYISPILFSWRKRPFVTYVPPRELVWS